MKSMNKDDFVNLLKELQKVAKELAIRKAGKHERDTWDNISIEEIYEYGISVRLTDYCGKYCHVDEARLIELSWEELWESLEN